MERIGIYVPGGTAAYPSTVLMTAIPASVAGVSEIIMVSPPSKEGNIPEPTLAAAKIAQVHRIFKIGGAQAIASLAYGTESVPKVDKICGPGNIFVTLAKKMVFGTVNIDGLAGPSEIFIVADDSANPVFCASDLIAQAEHDILAPCVLVTTSSSLADIIAEEIDRQLIETKRNYIAQKALEHGYIVVVDDIEQAINLVNIYAAEHVSLMCERASEIVPKIKNAGCIFVGEYSPVAFGDYMAGPSHVLPTSGTARFSSPLGVDDFLKTSDIIKSDQATLQEFGEAAISIAENEKLYGHAKTISIRLEKSYYEKTR
jgi:histidinol dehydrogenase